MVRLLTFAVALFIASPLLAQSCGTSYCAPRVVQRSYANNYVAPYVAPTYQTPQYITQNIFYSVGNDVRYPTVPPQAVVAAEYGQLSRELQRVQDKMSELKAYQQQYAPPQPQVVYVPVQTPVQVQPAAAPCPTGQCAPTQPAPQPTQPPADKPTFSMKAGSIIEQKCIKCHGANGKGDLDLRAAISCAQYKHAMDRLLTDDESIRMPKGQTPLTPEETAQAMKELSAMVKEEQQGEARAKGAMTKDVAAIIDSLKAK